MFGRKESEAPVWEFSPHPSTSTLLGFISSLNHIFSASSSVIQWKNVQQLWFFLCVWSFWDVFQAAELNWAELMPAHFCWRDYKSRYHSTCRSITNLQVVTWLIGKRVEAENEPLPGSFGSNSQVNAQLLSFSIQLKVQTTLTFFPPFFVFQCDSLSPLTLANVKLLAGTGSASSGRLQNVEFVD